MLAYSRLGWPLQALMTKRDGYEPEDIYAALSWTGRLQQPALSVVTMPSLLANNKKMQADGVASRSVNDPELAKHILLKTLKGLEKQMRRVTPAHRCVGVVRLCGDGDSLQR